MAYQFDFIEDTRKHSNAAEIVSSYQSRLTDIIHTLPGVSVHILPMREVEFGEPEPNISYRQTYKVWKNSRKVTWNQVFAAINTIQAPYYKRI